MFLIGLLLIVLAFLAFAAVKMTRLAVKIGSKTNRALTNWAETE